MKKSIIVLVLFLIAASTGVTESKAISPDPLPYWYSDGSKISEFTSESVIYEVTKYADCEISSSNLSTYIYKGETAWDDVFDITFTKYNPIAHNGYDIDTGCVSRDYADSKNWPISWVGTGGVYNKVFNESYYKPNSSGVASFYTHSSSYALLIWDSEGIDGAAKTSTFGLIEWWNIASHEFGHSIGFINHNTEGITQLMDSSRSWNVFPQTYDKSHMNLVYTYE